MINHVRTLLLNLDGPGREDTFPGEEFVPPEFAALPLRPELNRVYALLFGRDSDRAMRNLRLAQILPTIHSSALAPYATLFDSRLTYWPPRQDRLWRGLTFGASAKLLTGTDTPIAFTGDRRLFTTDGQLLHLWRVTVNSSTTVTVTRLAPVGAPVQTEYSISSGLSSPVALTGSGMSVVFGTPTAPYPSWDVTVMAEPSRDLAAVLRDLEKGGSDSDILFSGLEPYPTFASLWRSPWIPAGYRLGAWSLALAYKIQENVQPRIFTVSSTPEPEPEPESEEMQVWLTGRDFIDYVGSHEDATQPEYWQLAFDQVVDYAARNVSSERTKVVILLDFSDGAGAYVAVADKYFPDSATLPEGWTLHLFDASTDDGVTSYFAGTGEGLTGEVFPTLSAGPASPEDTAVLIISDQYLGSDDYNLMATYAENAPVIKAMLANGVGLIAWSQVYLDDPHTDLFETHEPAPLTHGWTWLDDVFPGIIPTLIDTFPGPYVATEVAETLVPGITDSINFQTIIGDETFGPDTAQSAFDGDLNGLQVLATTHADTEPVNTLRGEFNVEIGGHPDLDNGLQVWLSGRDFVDYGTGADAYWQLVMDRILAYASAHVDGARTNVVCLSAAGSDGTRVVVDDYFNNSPNKPVGWTFHSLRENHSFFGTQVTSYFAGTETATVANTAVLIISGMFTGDDTNGFMATLTSNIAAIRSILEAGGGLMAWSEWFFDIDPSDGATERGDALVLGWSWLDDLFPGIVPVHLGTYPPSWVATSVGEFYIPGMTDVLNYSPGDSAQTAFTGAITGNGLSVLATTGDGVPVQGPTGLYNIDIGGVPKL